MSSIPELVKTMSNFFVWRTRQESLYFFVLTNDAWLAASGDGGYSSLLGYIPGPSKRNPSLNPYDDCASTWSGHRLQRFQEDNKLNKNNLTSILQSSPETRYKLPGILNTFCSSNQITVRYYNSCRSSGVFILSHLFSHGGLFAECVTSENRV